MNLIGTYRNLFPSTGMNSQQLMNPCAVSSGGWIFSYIFSYAGHLKLLYGWPAKEKIRENNKFLFSFTLFGLSGHGHTTNIKIRNL